MTYGTKVDSWIGLVLGLVPIGLVFEAIFLRSRVVAAVAVSVLVVYWLVILPSHTRKFTGCAPLAAGCRHLHSP